MNARVKPDAVLQALGDATRRAIVERLAVQPASVSALAEPLGMSLTAVTQHLQVLERCGLVQTTKTGRVRTCRLDQAGFVALEEWIKSCRSDWERRLDGLENVLKEVD